MTRPFLRNAIGISLIGHLAFFGMCTVSFAPKIPQAGYAPIAFWGAVLNSSQVAAPFSFSPKSARTPLAREIPDTSSLDKARQSSPSEFDWHLKPALASTLMPQKQAFVESPAAFPVLPARKEPTLMLHPFLPYSFNLYFQDRQVAHVELMYNIASDGEKSSVMIKRKISSGNLEVDLLALRYISHYLFVQQARFNPNTWQSVKIDLSAKND